MFKRLILSVLLLSSAACGAGSPSSPSASDGSVFVQGYQFSACAASASPLPGWRNCPAVVKLNITRTIPSGIVSVYFNYPDAGSFYHGQLQVGSGIPGQVSVNVVNDYLPRCVSSFGTTIDVYDGAQSNPSAPLIVSRPVTLNVTCT